MKFELGKRVKICHTADDGREGTVIAVFANAHIMYGPHNANQMISIWAEKIGCTSEEIMGSPVYMIRFDEPLLNVPEEVIRNDMRDKFPNEGEFQTWLNTQKHSKVAAIEEDLQSATPNTVEEIIG